MVVACMQKVCRKCKLNKNILEYYKHSEMADGHLNICKICTKNRVKNYSENNEDKIRAYEKIRNQKPERRKRISANARKWRIKNPIAYRAQTAVGNALRDGKLFKKPCRFCGNDYINFLNVIWLCARCHHRMHHDIPRAEGDNKKHD
jgi:protein-arginine kinase activator protein McsA